MVNPKEEIQQRIDAFRESVLFRLVSLVATDYLAILQTYKIEVLRQRDHHSGIIREVFKSATRTMTSHRNGMVSNDCEFPNEISSSLKVEKTLLELIDAGLHSEPVKLCFSILNSFGFVEGLPIRNQLELINQYGLQEIHSPLVLRKKLEALIKNDRTHKTLNKGILELLDVLLIPLEYIPDSWEELAEMLRVIQVRDTSQIEIVRPPQGMPQELSLLWQGTTLPLSKKNPLVFSHSRMRKNSVLRQGVGAWWMVDTAQALDRVCQRHSDFMDHLQKFYGKKNPKIPNEFAFNHSSARIVNLALDE